MANRTVTIASRSGLHARPASQFVQAASAQQVPVTIAPAGAPERGVDATSILAVMTLGAKQGDRVILSADGENAAAALDQLAALLETNLDG